MATALMLVAGTDEELEQHKNLPSTVG